MTVGDFLKEKIFLTAKQFVHVTYYVYDVTYFDLVEAIVDIDFCCYLNRSLTFGKAAIKYKLSA